MLISESFDLYCSRYLIMRDRSAKTVQNYLNTQRLLIKFFGDVKISILVLDDYLKFRNYLSYQSIDTISNNLIRLKCVLRMLAKMGLISFDYTEIPIPVRQERSFSYFTVEEFDHIISLISKKRRGYKEVNRLRNIAVCNMLFSSGLRISELCSLNRDCFRGRSFTVLGKGKKVRPCFINVTTEEAIKNYLSFRSDNNPALFITAYNTRLSPGVFRKSLKTFSDRYNLGRINPHKFRHSFASHLLDNNVDLIYISDLLGHSSLETTKIYTHYKNTKLQQLYDKVML